MSRVLRDYNDAKFDSIKKTKKRKKKLATIRIVQQCARIYNIYIYSQDECLKQLTTMYDLTSVGDVDDTSLVAEHNGIRERSKEEVGSERIVGRGEGMGGSRPR